MASSVVCPCVSPDDFDIQSENELLGLDILHQKEHLIKAEECASLGNTHLGDSRRLELVTSSILDKGYLKGLDKSRNICDICEEYGLLWTVDIQNLSALVDVYHKLKLVTKAEAKIVASDEWRWREVAVSKNHDTAVKIADILYLYDVSNYARQILILADVYHEEELVTKEEAEKAASDVRKWREIAVTKDTVTATRIADILDEYEMNIEAKHIQVLVDVYHKEQLVTKEEAVKVASGEKKWGEVAFNRDVLKRIRQIMEKHELYATPSELSDALTEPLYRNMGNLNIYGELQSNIFVRTFKSIVSYVYDISHEGALSKNCWLPFDYVSIRVGKDGGIYDLCSDGQTRLTVPRNAVRGESAEIRCAIIGTGPFQLPPNYTLGSFVVYVYYNHAEFVLPVTLSLPTWHGGQVIPGAPPSDGLSFAVASHTPGRDNQYTFQLVEGGEIHSSRIHDVSIDGHSSLYAIVFEASATRLFMATHLIEKKTMISETTHKIIVSYASPTWIKIIENIYGKDAILSRNEFKFQNSPSGKLVGELQQEDTRGNGWAVAIQGCPEVPQGEISYEWLNLTTANDLKKAVMCRMYPPKISFTVHNTVGREEVTNPKLVNCTIRGADRPLQFPLYVLERVSGNSHKRPPSSDTNGSRRPRPDVPVFDSKQFMDSVKDDFLASVAAKDIALKLKTEHVIPDSVYRDIANEQTTDDDANLKLFNHLHQHGAHSTIQSLCDIMTNKRGYPNMITLGTTMNNRLPASSYGTRGP